MTRDQAKDRARAGLEAQPHSKAAAEQLDFIHAHYLRKALAADDRARDELLSTLVAAVAAAFALFYPSDDERAAEVACLCEEIPKFVERCHAVNVSLEGEPSCS
jgi:hypothetical protein